MVRAQEAGTAAPCVAATELERAVREGREADVRMIQGITAISYSGACMRACVRPRSTD